MQGSIKLSVDIMSGDIHPRSCFGACLRFIQSYPNVHLTLVGDADIWQELDLQAYPALSFVESLDVIGAYDALRDVLRKKHTSSMFKAIGLLASNDVDGCVSAGNTGALLAIGSKLLKKIPHVTRPAIARAMPTHNGSYIMLDLGATVDCSAKQLLEFALMGGAIAPLKGKAKPKVALLSNGQESTKGNKTLRLAQALMQDCSAIDYWGFIEGDTLFDTNIDVVVCDGLVGNIALKVSEGTARYMTQSLISPNQEASLQAKKRVWPSFGWSHVSQFFAQKQLQTWQQRHNPDNYNGALFAGFDAVLVKSHGSASEAGFFRALEFAYRQVEQKTPSTLIHYFSQLHLSSNKQT